jgi:hypothetical protein
MIPQSGRIFEKWHCTMIYQFTGVLINCNQKYQIENILVIN